MSDSSSKKGSNGTVDQIIEHMTADIQNSDGQYIQLGFTPPPTPNDPNIWSEYAQNAIPQNPFVSHYNSRSAESMGFAIDPNTRYVNQNVPYNNYMSANAIYVPEMTNAGYDKHLNIDMHGKKFVLFPGQAPQYVMTNQDISICNYMHPYSSENPLFNQEMQNIQIQQQQSVSNNADQLYMSDSVLMQQNHQQEVLKSKLLLQQQQQQQQQQQHQQTQNRTHLIENLVGNWTSNTNGTYSPFGNVQTNNSPTFFDLKQQEISPQTTNTAQFVASDNLIKQNISENHSSDTLNLNIDFLKNVKPIVKKQKQVAEVKPMRPTYSDVLTKPVPLQQNTTKPEKIETTKEAKNKNQLGKKSSRSDKSSKITLNRQISSTGSENTSQSVNNNGKTIDKDAKANLSRKWVSLDDVNEVHSNNKDFLKPELSSDNINSSKSKKNKKVDSQNNTNNIKNEQPTTNKNNIRKSYHDNSSLGCQWTENEDSNESFKNEEKFFNKNPSSSKKAKEPRSNSARQNRFNDRSSDKPPGSVKRSQRIRKKEPNTSFGLLGRNMQHYLSRWSKIILSCLVWFLHLIVDIFSMSVHLGRDLGTLLWDYLLVYSKSLTQNTLTLLKRVKFFTKIGAYIDKTFGGTRWAFWNRWNASDSTRDDENINSDEKSWLNSELEHNITMPTTGEEAMKRLLACKGKDPYSILGVRPDCTDDDIKRYYKRQAFLVHPDKNPQPGAEEAFKILVHAFELIGEPERRQSYDRKVAESHQVEQAWSELNELLTQLHQKMEYAANTIRCTNCTKRHRRVAVDRPCYAARMCSQCKIHHSAKEGDIWAETTCFGFLWHYYACMDGAVYDITEWAGCQRKNLKHLKSNSHNVQYRIVLGKQAQGGGAGGGIPVGGGGAMPGGGPHGRRHKGNVSGTPGEREADLESFLNNLYSQSDMSTAAGAGPTATPEGAGASATRNRKKNKRKK